MGGGKATTGHQREGFRHTCPRCGATRIDRQLGLEPTLAEYIANMVAVFREVRRVLRDDGVLWLNIGDSYGRGARVDNVSDNKRGLSSNTGHVSLTAAGAYGGGKREHLRGKDLMMVPARLAIALQDDGWYLRSDIIWHKPNPMPESVTDRPTSAHEHIFLLTKRSRYYYDADGIREQSITNDARRPYTSSGAWELDGRPLDQRHGGKLRDDADATQRNCRNVWTIATKPFSEAHFATFPPEIPTRCIKAGSREGDTVLDPFLGSGTTLLVADRLGRHGVGVELNGEYAQMARKRITNDCPLFTEVA